MKASYIYLFVCLFVCLFICLLVRMVGYMFVSAKDKEGQNCLISRKKIAILRKVYFFCFFLSYLLIFHKFQLTAVCCSCLTVSQSIRVLSTLCWASISTAKISISVALGFSAVFLCFLNPESQMFRSYHVLDYDLKRNETNMQSFESFRCNVPRLFTSKSTRVIVPFIHRYVPLQGYSY